MRESLRDANGLGLTEDAKNPYSNFLHADTTLEVGDTKASSASLAVNRKGIILVRRIPFSGLPARKEMDKYGSKI